MDTLGIRASIRKKYRSVAEAPQGHFPYPVGRESAKQLRYDPRWIGAVPPGVVDRFVGVGNPLSICMPQSGDVVLDVGCGSGFDTYVAMLKGATAFGIDPTVELLRPGLLAGRAEELPFKDGSFDMVISNGALNLVPDKDRTYREIFRVLRPEGTLAVADLLVVESVPDEVLADVDAWSTGISGALRGKDCLGKLEAAGFTNARILGPTGYKTSRFTAAHHITARK